MNKLWHKYPEEKPKSDKAIYMWSSIKSPTELTRMDYYIEYGQGEYDDINYWCYESDLIASITLPKQFEHIATYKAVVLNGEGSVEFVTMPKDKYDDILKQNEALREALKQQKQYTYELGKLWGQGKGLISYKDMEKITSKMKLGIESILYPIMASDNNEVKPSEGE